MGSSLQNIAQRVMEEISAYAASDVHVGIGPLLGAEWHARQVLALRAAIVAPYFSEMRDEYLGKLVVLPVTVVADDGERSLVIFDKVANEFVLTVREPDPLPNRGVNLVSCGIRGDVVGCFMSR